MKRMLTIEHAKTRARLIELEVDGFQGIDLSDRRISGGDIRKMLLVAADLSRSDLTDCLADFVVLCGGRLEEANISRIKMHRADLVGACLDRCVAVGASLTWTHFCGASLREADLREADLTGVDMAGCTLERAQMDRAKLGSTSFYRATLDHCSLRSASASHMLLQRASARSACFTGADLRSAWCLAADLTGSDFTGADLRKADMRLSILHGVNFQGANLARADFTGAQHDSTTRWPQGVRPKSA